jgi:hypothetical protein
LADVDAVLLRAKTKNHFENFALENIERDDLFGNKAVLWKLDLPCRVRD